MTGWLTVVEAASVLKVSSDTIHRMLREGRLESFRTSSRGHWRIRCHPDGSPVLKAPQGAAGSRK